MQITIKHGYVELRDAYGNMARRFGTGDVVNAVWSGENVLLFRRDGRTELRDKIGNLVKAK
jgi:hypothetical protein